MFSLKCGRSFFNSVSTGREILQVEYDGLQVTSSHVQYTQTDTIRQFRWSIGTNGRIGTNRKGCHSNGSVGEYASHQEDFD